VVCSRPYIRPRTGSIESYSKPLQVASLYCQILYFKSVRLVEYISHTLSFRWSHKKDLLPLDLIGEEAILCFCSEKSVTVETMRLCCN